MWHADMEFYDTESGTDDKIPNTKQPAVYLNNAA